MCTTAPISPRPAGSPGAMGRLLTPGHRISGCRAPISLVLAMVVLLGAGGCNLVRKAGNYKIPGLFGGNLVLRVAVAEDLNRDSPVAVDLVVVYDEKTLQTLGEMSAAAWFAGKEQFLKDPSKDKVQIYHWEWVPGQAVPEKVLPYRRGAAGGLVFADYFAPGEHRATFDPFKPFLLRLGTSEVTVEPLS